MMVQLRLCIADGPVQATVLLYVPSMHDAPADPGKHTTSPTGIARTRVHLKQVRPHGVGVVPEAVIPHSYAAPAAAGCPCFR